MRQELVATLPIQEYSGKERYKTGELPEIGDRVRSLGKEWIVVSFSCTMLSVWFTAGTGNMIVHCELLHRGEPPTQWEDQ